MRQRVFDCETTAQASVVSLWTNSLGNVHSHTKPELSLSDFFFLRNICVHTKLPQNDVVYMPEQYVAL